MKFWSIIFLEAVFSPFLFLFNELKNRFSSKKNYDQIQKPSLNVQKINRTVFVVHEWAGYPIERTKQIKPFLSPFACGLKNQLESLIHYRKNFQKDRLAYYFLTISDFSDAYVKMLENINLPIGFFEKIPVSNIGMDFSGYGHIIRNKLEESDDDLVFLINSSVSGNFSDKIDDYIKAFELNHELGLLGVSYSTKIYQTLIRNNFRPHVQSFFMVARASVLVKILKNNNLVFPGENETNKYSIIRFGEAKLTKLIQDLGFQVGVVETDGQLHLLPQATVFNNYFNSWRLPHGDRRLSNGLPNYVHKLKL